MLGGARLDVNTAPGPGPDWVGRSVGGPTHQADAADPGLGHGALAHVGRLLPEEEVQLVVVLFRAVWDEVCVDEGGV